MSRPLPLVGDFIVIRSDGIVARLIQLLTFSTYNHVAGYVGVRDGVPTLMEANPSGLALVPLSKYDGYDYVVSRYHLSDEQRAAVVAFWLSIVGQQYGFLDIVAMAFTRLGFKSQWLVNLAKKQGHLVCSQTASKAYEQVGLHIYQPPETDWWAQSPGDLAKDILIELDWAS